MKFLKNKKVVLASGIILGIAAITSSALAAYIVTGGTKGGSETIYPSEITVENHVTNLTVKPISGTLLFEPRDAASGRVSTKGGGNLTVNVPLEITADSKDYIDNMTATVTASEGSTVVSANYITLPEVQTITKNDFDGSGTSWTYSLPLTFGFGSTFGNTDPATYYNEDEKGATVGINTVISTLEKFATAINATTFTVTIGEAPAAAA